MNAILLTAYVWVVMPAASDMEFESLAGLPGVCVNIVLGGAAEDTWLDEIQVAVELRLRKNGIRVFTDEELANSLSRPYLQVAITANSLGDDTAHVGVSLFQWMRRQIEPVGPFRRRHGLMEGS